MHWVRPTRCYSERLTILTYTTWPDRGLIAGLIVSAVALFFLLPGWIGFRGDRVEVCVGDAVIERLDLSKDRSITVPGKLGPTVVELKNRRARIVSSPCPHKLCLAMGAIGAEGGILVCIPNELLIRIGNENPAGLDAVSR